MKNLVLMCGLLMVLSSSAQDKKSKTQIEPPVAVTLAFEKQFPNVQGKWSRTYRGEMLSELNFDADFTLKNIPMMATYTEAGVFKALACEISPGELPQLARDYLKKNYPNLPVQKIIKVTNDVSQTHYEVGLLVQGQLTDAIFNAQGDFLNFAGK
ncbi:MAG: hypothetical protein JST78_11110 [Bacteroidetes bacterium]|nr:hypothetical protein [Bacteroidota bacterium]